MKETEQICKAEKKDIDAVAAIYAHIHEQERTGKVTIGWLPGIYPVRGTAEAALARENGCTVLRMDTNAKNAAARRLYQKLGYAESDIVPCIFNGIPNVQLVLLEKKLTLNFGQLCRAGCRTYAPARKRKTVWGRGGETWFQRHC